MSTSRGKPRENRRASKRKTAHGTLQPLPLAQALFFLHSVLVCAVGLLPQILSPDLGGY